MRRSLTQSTAPAPSGLPQDRRAFRTSPSMTLATGRRCQRGSAAPHRVAARDIRLNRRCSRASAQAKELGFEASLRNAERTWLNYRDSRLRAPVSRGAPFATVVSHLDAERPEERSKFAAALAFHLAREVGFRKCCQLTMERRRAPRSEGRLHVARTTQAPRASALRPNQLGALSVCF